MNIVTIILLIVACNSTQEEKIDGLPSGEKVSSIEIGEDHSDSTIMQRIKPPTNYLRTEAEVGTFQYYLRTLKLKPPGTKVKYFNGATKANYGVYEEVVDLDIGRRDLHQCADAVMRLKAEYLWLEGKYEAIHFNFTNGFRVDYSEWMKGRRVVVNGNAAYWNNRSNPSNTYKDFWKYMELIFAYAGTASLEKELVHVENEEVEIGDVLIQGGFPGHAVIIVDKARNEETGSCVYLLAQSYMPAQEIQVLKNPTNSRLSPWYELNEGRIKTPEWNFERNDLKRFQD
jgi:hypothetical protein